MKTKESEEIFNKIESHLKAKYESYKILKGYTFTAKAWRRAWLDVKRIHRKHNQVVK